jgi:hypothetical protein
MRLYTYLAGGTAGIALIAATMVACEVTVVPTPVSTDSGDIADGNSTFDATKPDAVASDAQSDAPVTPDAAVDSGRDGAATDGGGADGGGGGLSKAELLDQLSTEVCNRLKGCCPGKPFVTIAECKGYQPEGYYGSFPFLLDNQFNPKVVVNQAKASACIAQAKINDCETTGRSAANEKAFRLTCAQAIEGTVTSGGACNYDIECVRGFNCSSVPGVAGTCVVNGTLGSPCKYFYDNGYVKRDTCSANASGDTGLRCDSGTSKCVAGLLDGDKCLGTPGQCGSGACNPGPGTCGQKLFSPDYCDDFAP